MDGSRHDNDESLPRTPTEIKELNSIVAKKMREIFLGRGIPVVPSLGDVPLFRPSPLLETNLII
jgi:endopolyphosphatase